MIIKGRKIIPDMPIRKLATCSGGKTLKPFLIKMKDVPQIKLSITKVR